MCILQTDAKILCIFRDPVIQTFEDFGFMWENFITAIKTSINKRCKFKIYFDEPGSDWSRDSPAKIRLQADNGNFLGNNPLKAYKNDIIEARYSSAYTDKVCHKCHKTKFPGLKRHCQFSLVALSPSEIRDAA